MKKKKKNPKEAHRLSIGEIRRQSSLEQCVWLRRRRSVGIRIPRRHRSVFHVVDGVWC